jgi:hypothetical protein
MYELAKSNNSKVVVIGAGGASAPLNLQLDTGDSDNSQKAQVKNPVSLHEEAQNPSVENTRPEPTYDAH